MISCTQRGRDAISPETISPDSSLVPRRESRQQLDRDDVSLLPRLFCDAGRTSYSARRERESTPTTGSVVENSGSVASNDRINSAGLPDARSLCVPAREEENGSREKKKEAPGRCARTARSDDAAGRRVFEKLKKNRGGVYRSRGWKNFSDGGF